VLFRSFLPGCGDDGAVEIPTTEVSGTVSRNGTPVDAFVAFYSYGLTASALSGSTLSVPDKNVNSTGGSYKFTDLPAGPCYIAAWESEEDWKNYPDYPRAGIQLTLQTGSHINNADLFWGTVESLPATPLSGNAFLSGTVSDSDRGSPVPGSTVTLWETGQTAVTDGEGRFSFNNIAEGIYTVILSKTGYAASRAQEVRVTEGSNTELDMVHMPLFNPDWMTLPPNIKVSGVIEGDVIDTTREVTIYVTSENNMKTIKARVGNKHSYDSVNSAREENVLTLDLVPENLPPDDTYIYIYAYDANNNRSEITININPRSGQTGTALSDAPSNVIAEGKTFGESLQVYSEEEAGENILTGTGDLPPDSSCYVTISWDEVSNAAGYRLYRSTEPEGSYEFVGETSGISMFDADPSAVYPGQTLYYRVSAYNSGGEGPLSSASPSMTLLDVFRVNLTGPSHNAGNVPLNTPLTWTINTPAGDRREYEVYVWQQNGYMDYAITLDNSISDSSVMITGLLPGTVYEWNVASVAMGSEDPNNPGIYRSFSYPSNSFIPVLQYSNKPLSNNGAFKFTTEP